MIWAAGSAPMGCSEMRRWLLLLQILLAPTALAAESSVFDPPAATERVTLGKSRGKNQLDCFYFAGLRVKQLDLGEVGAAQLAILPLKPDAKRVACHKQREPGEIVIRGADWSGYFKGVRASYVFFDADDGTNGGLGFAVFDGHDGKKLFSDVAVGKIGSAEPTEGGIRLRYRRALLGPCSIVSGGAACWPQFVQTAAVPAEPMPDCAAGYLKAKTEMARGRCEAQNDKTPGCFESQMAELDRQRWDEAPSVLAYDVEAEIGHSRQNLTPVGGERSCWPSD